ncbi:MAG: TIGR03618 family F420-dependent PPOX class oxidoreductase [Myxococcota bacterium]
MAPSGYAAGMARALDANVKRLLDAPNFASLATLMPDGAPKVEPVWVGREGDLVLIATDSRSLKGRNLDADGRVALSVTDYENPYEQALIRGRVIETRDDNDLQVLDALSQQYLGKPFPRRKWTSRVVYVVEASVARYYQSPLEHTPGA